jgi:hypothetical protein
MTALKKVIFMVRKMVRPDSKGRITLGHLAEGVSGFLIIKSKKSNRLILEPYAEIPAREKWLFDNKRALESVKKGIRQSAAGQISKIGDFTKYIDEDE